MKAWINLKSMSVACPLDSDILVGETETELYWSVGQLDFKFFPVLVHVLYVIAHMIILQVANKRIKLTHALINSNT